MRDPQPGRLLGWLSENLASVSETPSLDASVLLAAVLGTSRSWVLAHPEVSLSSTQEANLKQALARLLDGEPLPYIVGEWEFYGMRFKVTPAALIPRPETELLVEEALQWLTLHPTRRRALDIGTGTGCIAASLAANCPDLVCTAIDISPAALLLAAQNIRQHHLERRVSLVQASLLTAIAPACCDLLCANLPYIPSRDLAHLQVAHFEPVLALDGGGDGLAVINALMADMNRVLSPGGLALLEIEERQTNAVQALADHWFPLAQIEVLPDLAGKPRLLRIQFPN
jgi:release factor glutamine methyltransferase